MLKTPDYKHFSKYVSKDIVKPVQRLIMSKNALASTPDDIFTALVKTTVIMTNQAGCNYILKRCKQLNIK